jgi:hypothetical protein
MLSFVPSSTAPSGQGFLQWAPLYRELSGIPSSLMALDVAININKVNFIFIIIY